MEREKKIFDVIGFIIKASTLGDPKICLLGEGVITRVIFIYF